MPEGFKKWFSSWLCWNKSSIALITNILYFGNAFHDSLTGNIDNMGETAKANISMESQEGNNLPYPPLNMVKGNFPATKGLFKVEHERIIVSSIIQGHPANLPFKNINSFKASRQAGYTWDATPIRSNTNRKSCAMCFPVWWPGKWWKPTRSARNVSSSVGGPEACSTLTAWIQCAVTAMYGTILCDVQISDVKEIFPIASSNGDDYAAVKMNQRAHLHFSSNCIKLLLPELHNATLNGGSMWNVWVLKFLPKHEKDRSQLWAFNNIDRLEID